jgi:hypothetical protein
MAENQFKLSDEELAMPFEVDRKGYNEDSFQVIKLIAMAGLCRGMTGSDDRFNEFVVETLDPSNTDELETFYELYGDIVEIISRNYLSLVEQATVDLMHGLDQAHQISSVISPAIVGRWKTAQTN